MWVSFACTSLCDTAGRCKLYCYWKNNLHNYWNNILVLLSVIITDVYASDADTDMTLKDTHVYVSEKEKGFRGNKRALLLLQSQATVVLDIIIIITNPSTARVVGAPQVILQPVSSFFPVLHCPLGLAELQTCPFPDVVFPPLPLSTFSSSPFHCALQDGFGQAWWTGDMTILLQFASLYDHQEVFVWSNCLLDLGTDFLVGNMVFVWDV